MPVVDTIFSVTYKAFDVFFEAAGVSLVGDLSQNLLILRYPA